MGLIIKIIISICLVLVITFISFLPSLKNGFTNLDDGVYITNNIMIQNLSLQNIKKMFTSIYCGLYQPLVLLSFAIEYNFFKLTPFFFHLTNLFLHLLNSLLVFWLIFILSRQISVSIIVALLFGIHPLRVESVAWVTERKDLLYTIFFLCSIICYIYYQKNQTVKYYYLSLFLFVLSLLAKSMAITLPFILVLYDYFFVKKFDRNTLREKIIFFAISFIFVIITIFGSFKVNTLGNTSLILFFYRIFYASYGIVFYLTKMIIPVKLSCFYPHPANIRNMLPFTCLISPVIIVILIAIMMFSIKYTKKIIFGFLFFLITILPVIQLFPTSIVITAADHFTYIPLIGLFYIIGEGFSWLYLKHSKIIKTILLIVLTGVITILSILTWQRCKVWMDNFTLWDDVLKNYPNVAIAYNNRGNVYLNKGEYGKAIYDYNQALKINPNYSVVYYNKGNAYLAVKEYNKAIFNYNQALKINQNYAVVYNNRAVAYFKKRKYNKALEDVKKSQSLGYQVDQKFLKDISKFTGR